MKTHNQEPDERGRRQPLIKIVGVCASGKTTLANRLQTLGFNAKPCAQEHSDLPTMWAKINPADILIYLDASLKTVARRRPRTDWDQVFLDTEHRRLAHARQHADLIVATDCLDADQVAEKVAQFLEAKE